MESPSIVIVGAGALGGALASALTRSGYAVDAVLSRTEESARRLAEQVGAGAFTDPARLPETLDWAFLCVPDDELASVAEMLGGTGLELAAHTSGRYPADQIAALAAQGIHIASFHPLQSFVPGVEAEWKGVPVALEGDERAVSRLEELARSLGARPFRIDASQKARYHLAASVASNFMVTLEALAFELFSSLGWSEEETRAFAAPLLETTLRRTLAQGPEAALSGPVVRGDRQTLIAHLETLRDERPDLLPAYAAMATETVRLAVGAERLELGRADALLDALHAYCASSLLIPSRDTGQDADGD